MHLALFSLFSFLLLVPVSGIAGLSASCGDTELADGRVARICINNIESPTFVLDEHAEENIISSHGGEIISCLVNNSRMNSSSDKDCINSHPYYLRVVDRTNGASDRDNFFLVQESPGGFKRIPMKLEWHFRKTSDALIKNESIEIEEGAAAFTEAELKLYIDTSSLGTKPEGLYTARLYFHFETEKGHTSIQRFVQIKAHLRPAIFISGVQDIDLSGKPENGWFTNEAPFCVFSRSGDSKYSLTIDSENADRRGFRLKRPGSSNFDRTIGYQVQVKDSTPNGWRTFESPGTENGLKGGKSYTCGDSDNAILRPRISVTDVTGAPEGDYFDILTLTVEPM